jgi:hypothetical protein
MSGYKAHIGTCVTCHRTRKLTTGDRCFGCYGFRKWHKASTWQTILPTTLHRGDVLICHGVEFRVTEAWVRPCELDPAVVVRTKRCIDGKFFTITLDAEVYVPVKAVRHAS